MSFTNPLLLSVLLGGLCGKNHLATEHSEKNRNLIPFAFDFLPNCNR